MVKETEGTVDIEELKEDTIDRPEEMKSEPGRRRRTKAQIEADKQSSEEDEQVPNNDEPLQILESVENLHNVQVQKDTVDEEDVTDVVSEDTAKDDIEDKDSNRANEVLEERYTGTLMIHKLPSEGSCTKKLSGCFLVVGVVGDFVQVQYLRRGYGLVTGYVHKKVWRSLLK